MSSASGYFECQNFTECLHREAQFKWKTDFHFYHQVMCLPNFQIQSLLQTFILLGTRILHGPTLATGGCQFRMSWPLNFLSGQEEIPKGNQGFI